MAERMGVVEKDCDETAAMHGAVVRGRKGARKVAVVNLQRILVVPDKLREISMAGVAKWLDSLLYREYQCKLRRRLTSLKICLGKAIRGKHFE